MDCKTQFSTFIKGWVLQNWMRVQRKGLDWCTKSLPTKAMMNFENMDNDAFAAHIDQLKAELKAAELEQKNRQQAVVERIYEELVEKLAVEQLKQLADIIYRAANRKRIL